MCSLRVFMQFISCAISAVVLLWKVTMKDFGITQIIREIVFMEEYFTLNFKIIFSKTGIVQTSVADTGYQTVQYSTITRVSAKRFMTEVARIQKQTNKNKQNP